MVVNPLALELRNAKKTSSSVVSLLKSKSHATRLVPSANAAMATSPTVPWFTGCVMGPSPLSMTKGVLIPVVLS